MAVASARPYANLHLTPDNRANIPPLNFLQARCPSCHPTTFSAECHFGVNVLNCATLENLIVDGEEILNSHDVVSLFTNTPVDKALEVTEQKFIPDQG